VRDTQRQGRPLSRENADRRVGGRVTLPDGQKFYVLNTHWRPGADASTDLQSYLLTSAPPVSPAALAEDVAARAAAPNAYGPTIERVREAQGKGLPVLTKVRIWTGQTTTRPAAARIAGSPTRPARP
jgi:hypothetical protein